MNFGKRVTTGKTLVTAKRIHVKKYGDSFIHEVEAERLVAQSIAKGLVVPGHSFRETWKPSIMPLTCGSVNNFLQ